MQEEQTAIHGDAGAVYCRKSGTCISSGLVSALDQRDPVARAYVQAQTDALKKKAAGLTRAGLDAGSEEALAAALTAWAQGKEQEHAG